MVRPGDAVAAAPRYIGAMRNAPVFSLHRLDRLGDRLADDVATGAIAGADLLVGGTGGDIWRRTVGFRDSVAGDDLKPDALWRIYSMTKVVVSVAALVLAERGALRLDQPVADFIPAFGRLAVQGPEGGLRPAGSAPTVQDLLRHTAGIAYGYLGDGPTRRAYEADGLLAEDLDNAAFAERIARLPLEQEPGTVWHYSHATDILGRVLEVAGGADLQGVLDATLLGPLGLADTRFRIPTALAGRVAQPLPQAFGQRPVFHDPTEPRRSQRGNGGLVSSTADYARFLRMLLAGGALGGVRILAPASVRLMTADHLGTAIAKAAYYPPGPGYGFGLGVAVRLAAGEAPVPGSVGDWFWSSVGGTYFWVDPAAGFFALLMLQTSSAAQRQHYRTLTRAMVYAALEDGTAA
ncbi:beta-lactamase family protein [Methylobacterium sp. J-088]|uniref:serine hydrolase domain-containing protein n=1 Tax=Methylobacterium sp. J-088 TaxID=2836664 RepID=UPI001FB90262|nr:serine hydrolase [Methylobacterium sp. J-088]MCJ2063300.1 beta-lactamase family protein [Methylobacterium sp. J-088]